VPLIWEGPTALVRPFGEKDLISFVKPASWLIDVIELEAWCEIVIIGSRGVLKTVLVLA
jgi:hypothetical protein